MDWTTDAEAVRLQAVQELGLLDTECEAEFDELVHLAAAICDVPMSAVTLVDAERQWFKAAVGLPVRETPREVAFCAHAIQQAGLFLVEDASCDPRFSANSLVTGDPHIRFYAGIPLAMADGSRVGTLCAIDTVPRQLTESQKHALCVLSRQVVMRMEMRAKRRALEQVISEKNAIEVELRAREHLFTAFMDNSPFVGYMKNEDGQYEYYNRRFCELFSIDSQAWLGTRDTDHFTKEQAAGYRYNDLRAMEKQNEIVVTETTVNESGVTRWWESHKFGYRDPFGRRLLGGVSVDVTRDYQREIDLQASKLELEERNAQLQSLTLVDGLTGLKNRRAFEERLKLEFSRAQRTDRPLALIMLDIDLFKKVNDELGHAAGDTVLCEVAQGLQASVRNTDMAARFGGEEFAVILSETDAENALLWTRRLQQTLSGMRWRHRPVTLSMGIAELTPMVHETVQLLKRADESLYAAKRTGRARAVVYGRALAADILSASSPVPAIL